MLFSTLSITTSADVKYLDKTETDKHISYVNSFRTSNKQNTWAWNENNSAKVYYHDIKKVTYDPELERIAKIRAEEISRSFSHTRPNGQMFYSLYSDFYCKRGENLLRANTKIEPDQAFELWKEENEEYENQGHRRNMLNSGFERIGVACAIIDGNYYWVQEFGTQYKINNVVIGKGKVSKIGHYTDKTVYTYNGKNIKPEIFVYDKDPRYKLPNSAFSVTYPSDTKNVGTKKVVIKIKGTNIQYTKTYKIIPAGAKISSFSKIKRKSLTMSLKKNLSSCPITGYQIRYSTKSNMSNCKKITTNKKSYKITKLSPKKKYYIQVRTYKTVNGVKHYSAWSSKRTVITKK